MRTMRGNPMSDLIIEGRWHVVRRGRWWVVDDLRTRPRDTVTGGYLTKREATDAARLMASDEDHRQGEGS